MKRILITGTNSYIGNACESWLSSFPDQYEIHKVSVREDTWRLQNWKKYDSIIHVAGIAHNSSEKSLESLYYQVNRDLTYEIGLKAKNDGVKHFVNMSSIIVFGTNNEEITNDTLPTPDNFYGDSKLQAEHKLNTLVDESFVVAHIRPPMVYGRDSKGNFPKLAELAIKTPFFPEYGNKRSMIYVKNLTELIRLVIEGELGGNIHPQNPEYVNISHLVKFIANTNNHKIRMSKSFNFAINRLSNINIVNKVFGDLYYNKEMSDGELNYQIYDLETSIQDIFTSKDRR